LKMQPFDYRIAVQDPLQMALAGYQQGQQFQQQRVQGERETQLYDMEMQQYQANQAKLQEEQAKAKAMQGDLASFTERLTAGTATVDDVLRLNSQYPEIAEQVQSSFSMKSQAQKDGEIRQLVTLATAMKNSPEYGAKLLEERIAAAEAAGKADEVASLKSIQAEMGVDPMAPVAAVLPVLANLMDPKQFETFATTIMPPPEKAPEAFRTLQLRAEQAGLQPGTAEYQAFMEQGGAERGPIAQINVGGEAGAFETAIGKGQAENIMAVSTQGQTARRNRQTLSALQTELAASPSGAEAAVKNVLGNIGVPTEGLSNIQATEALINQLVPAQRPPGSGTMSDRDVALFKSSLPRLINTPEGNRKIISTMLAMNEYLVREGELADAVIDGAITREQYREKIRALNNPLAEFSTGGGGATGGRRKFDAQGREIK
jgi:hypothetical protein